MRPNEETTGGRLDPRLWQKVLRQQDINILVYGPAGCGKTLLAKAIMGELEEKGRRTFYYVAPENVLVRGRVDYIQSDMTRAAEEKKAAFFLDDLATLLKDLQTKPEALRVFLGRLKEHPRMVLATTRYPWELDDEVLSIFDVHFPVLYPTKDGRKEILQIHFRKHLAMEQIDGAFLDGLAEETAWFSGLELEQLVVSMLARRNADFQDSLQMRLHSIKTQVDMENRRVELEKFIEFTRQNPRVSARLKEAAEKTAVEFGLVCGPELVKLCEVSDFLEEMGSIKLDDYRVCGNYFRFEQGVRNILIDLMPRVEQIFREKTRWKNWNNFVLWGNPGSGKTHFVKELARACLQGVQLVILNVAKSTRGQLEETLDLCSKKLKEQEKLLLFIDEVDAKEEEPWILPTLLKPLEWGREEGKPVICFVAGSKGERLEEFLARLSKMNKGPDFLSRVPETNRVAISALTYRDRIIIFVALTANCALEANCRLERFEKAALATVAIRSDLSQARAIYDTAVSAAGRIALTQKLLAYDHLFDTTDSSYKYEFLLRYPRFLKRLLGKYVALVND